MILYAECDFYVRDSTPTDVPLYAKLLRNEVWLQNSSFIG